MLSSKKLSVVGDDSGPLQTNNAVQGSLSPLPPLALFSRPLLTWSWSISLLPARLLAPPVITAATHHLPADENSVLIILFESMVFEIGGPASFPTYR